MSDKIYTGFGDKGYTRTMKNMRIPKSDSLIELLGNLDEFTAVLNISKTAVKDKKLFDDIEAVQKKIIEISGEIAGGKTSVTKDCISAIERMIDEYETLTGGFRGFEVTDSNFASAQLNVARTVIRRAERSCVKVGQFGRIQSVTLVYLNRLSDLIYFFARYAQISGSKNMRMEAVNMANDDTKILSVEKLTLGLVKEIALAVERQAESMGLNVVIAILDEGANLMLLHSMDNAYIASCQIAQDKAYTAVSLKMSTQTALEESRGGALDGLTATTGNGLLLLGGGMPLRMNGKIVGGLGVSGGTAEEDIDFAQFGADYLERRLSLRNDR